MTQEQIKKVLEMLLRNLSGELEQDAMNERQDAVKSALYAVSARLGSMIDDLDYMFANALEEKTDG